MDSLKRFLHMYESVKFLLELKKPNEVSTGILNEYTKRITVMSEQMFITLSSVHNVDFETQCFLEFNCNTYHCRKPPIQKISKNIFVFH